VLLLERAKLPRHKACGGGLTGNVRRSLDFELGDVVETCIRRVVHVFKGRFSVLHELEGLSIEMVQRPLFDNLLATKAVEAGAILLDETPLKRLVLDHGTKLVETPNGTFQADVVIGADGAASVTARAVGLRPDARQGIAMDAELVVSADAFQAWKRTVIFDFGFVPHGYGWVFPKGTFFSVGVATADERCVNIRAHLDALIRRHDCLSNPLSMTVRAAPLPNWTHDEPLARHGVFLVGDAAGLVDPVSGEGISYAVRSGVIAADFANAWLAGDHAADVGYSEAINHRITRGFVFAKQLASAFFQHPTLCYLIEVRSRRVNEIFARLTAGEIDYVELHRQLRASWPGRIVHLLKPLFKWLSEVAPAA